MRTRLGAAVSLKDKEFFEELGLRIAEFRTAAGLTQAALADRLGCSQQHLQSFEKGRYRVPANLLPVMAELFGVSLDDLLGVSTKTEKRGPPSKLERQIQQLGRLSKAKQRFISEMLDGLLQQAS